MRFVRVKSAEQQGRLMLHRTRVPRQPNRPRLTRTAIGTRWLSLPGEHKVVSGLGLSRGRPERGWTCRKGTS